MSFESLPQKKGGLESSKARIDFEKRSEPESLNEVDDRSLIALVEQVNRKRNPEKSFLTEANIAHTKQIVDKALEIAHRLKKTMPELELSLDHLRVMAAVHDIAKFDQDGKMDVFGHHVRERFLEALNQEVDYKEIIGEVRGSDSDEQFDEAEMINRLASLKKERFSVADYLRKQGFSDEDIDFIATGVEVHSGATAFIRKNYLSKLYQSQQEDAPKVDLPPDAPTPEGSAKVAEYMILADADVMNQAKVDEGFRKIVTFRLNDPNFRKTELSNGRHDLRFTLNSAALSANEAASAMHFKTTKEEASRYAEQVNDFMEYLEKNGVIDRINQLPFGDEEGYLGGKTKLQEFNDELNHYLRENS